MRRLVLLAFALFFLWAPAARANGRFPASNAVVFDPHDPKTIYVRVTFGLLVTRDGGATWSWICERAIGFSGIEDPTYVVTPNGTLAAGTFSGLATSRDLGCSWSFSGGENKHLVSDLAMRPDGSIVGIVSTYSKAGDGGSLYDDHLIVSKDDAVNFTTSGGPIDPTLLLESVEVAPSDPARLYLSAVRGEGERRTAAFLASYNDGLSWVERKLDLVAGETAGFIAIVDPKNADRVYVRTSGAPEAASRLLVTDDAGKTWRKIYEASSPLVGFALSDDGSKVYVGSKEGAASSPTNAFSFVKGSVVEVQCLGAAGSTLWACSGERSGFIVGSSKSGGRGFDARLHLDEIKGPIDCPAGTSVARICADEWPKLRRDLGLPEAGEKSKGKSADPGAPALRGRETRTRRGGSTLSAAFGIAALGMAAYFVLKRLRRR